MFEDQGVAGAVVDDQRILLRVCNHKHDRMVRTLIRTLYTQGHILRPEQQVRFSALCVKTDVTIVQALEAFQEISSQCIKGKTLVRDAHVESSYRVFLQAMNILADYVARGLEAASKALHDGHIGDDQDDGHRVRMWAASCWKLVVPLSATDRRWPVITPSVVLRIVSSADALSDRASQAFLAELGGRIDQRMLHRWIDLRSEHHPVATGHHTTNRAS